jgi:hypothetical protein
LLAAFCVAVPGCASPRRAWHGGASIDEAVVDLEKTSRGIISPDLSELPPEASRLGGASAATYYELAAADCQCRAAERSALGELLARERRVLCVANARWLGCQLEWRMQSTLISAAERDARNRAAATALKAFYKLAELESQHDLVDLAEAETAGALARIATVRAEGVRVPFDETILVRKRLDLAARRIEIAGGIERANAALKSLLDLPLAAGERLWPVDDWKVKVPEFDVEFEVLRGIEQSAELHTAHALDASLSPETLATARAALTKIEGLAGMSPAAAPPLDFLRGLVGQPTSAEREVSARRRQIATYADRREAELAGEIRQRLADVSQAAALVAMARDELDAWRARLAELEAKADTGQSTFADIAQAKLESLGAEGRAIERTMAWKTSLVDLRAVQGLLIEECRPRD